MGSKKRAAWSKAKSEFLGAATGGDMSDLFAREDERRDALNAERDEAWRYKSCERKNRYDTRAEAEAVIKRSAALGSRFCLIHHTSAEQLVNKNKQTIERLPDYLSMIRDRGMIPGLSAHMPELVLYSDKNEYDVQTYIQIYNCMGFMMQVEIEAVNKIIHEAKKPVMTIKSMAAGRCSPFVGITFSYNTIRPCDMVTVGAMTADEVHEDVEIAMAALEHRRPDLEGRNSPNRTEILQ